MACIFCQIIEGRKPAKRFYEDENSVVFADINPKAPVHLLIVPKKHFERLVELPNEVLVQLIDTARDVALKLKLENNFLLIQRNGPGAGQIVDHLHFHFMSHADIDIEYMD